MIGRVTGEVFDIGAAKRRDDEAAAGRAEVAGRLGRAVVSEPIDGEGDDRIAGRSHGEMHLTDRFGAGDVVNLDVWNGIVFDNRDGGGLDRTADGSASGIREVESEDFVALINVVLNGLDGEGERRLAGSKANHSTRAA